MIFGVEDYIEEELENLKDMIENNTFDKQCCNNFIIEDNLEVEYSHDEIGKIQTLFMKKAREYLYNNYCEKYAIWCDWCVHITTVDLYRELMWKNTNSSEKYKIKREKKDIVG